MAKDLTARLAELDAELDCYDQLIVSMPERYLRFVVMNTKIKHEERIQNVYNKGN